MTHALKPACMANAPGHLPRIMVYTEAHSTIHKGTWNQPIWKQCGHYILLAARRWLTLMTKAFPAYNAAVKGLKTLWNG